MAGKVLLIDDEQNFLEVLAERMSYRDIDATTVTSAEEGLGLLAHSNYDAIILDLQMPGMNGLEALERIKAMNPDLQVILLTGHATEKTGEQALQLGASDFMEKPANIQLLARKIREAHARKIILVEKENEEKIRALLDSKKW